MICVSDCDICFGRSCTFFSIFCDIDSGTEDCSTGRLLLETVSSERFVVGISGTMGDDLAGATSFGEENVERNAVNCDPFVRSYRREDAIVGTGEGAADASVCFV